MLLRHFILTIITAFISAEALAVELITPPSLNLFSSSPIYSITQDSQGAMWFNANSGPYRYNGHSLTNVGASSSTYLAKFATSDSEILFLNHPNGILKISTSVTHPSHLEIIAPSLPENSPLLAQKDSLFFACDNQVYAYCDGSTKVIASLDEGYHVRSLKRLKTGEILAAAYESVIGVISDGVFHKRISLQSTLLATFISDSGFLWAGTSKDGLVKIDTQDFTVSARYTSPDSHPMLDVRCFAEDKDGNLYFGAASGLFKLNPEGKLERLLIDGVETMPVCDVFVDRDGNLWVSTYYNGVYYANLTAFPFRHLSQGMTLGTSRGIVMTSDGTLCVASDPYGLLTFRDGVWSSEPGLGECKFQSAYCDPVTGDLFLGNWDGMVRHNLQTGEHKLIPFAESISVGSRVPVFSVRRHGKEMYVGTTIGAFYFNPEKEDVISRRVEGVGRRINSILELPDGDLYLAGQGLFSISGNAVRDIEEYGSCFILDLKRDSSGSLWAALSSGGILNITNVGEDIVYNKQNCGLPDCPISYVIPLGNGAVVAGTSFGISILDPLGRCCRNYDRSNGLRMKCASKGGSFRMADGTILLGGNGAIEILDPSGIPHSGGKSFLTFDSCTVNDRPYDLSNMPGSTLVLDHKATNLRFDIATFDYSSVKGHIYSYKLEGVDDDWHEFDILEPISCMNLGPGHYRIRVRESDNFESVRSEIAMPITILPVWYFSFPFIVLWTILFSVFAIFIVYTIHTRKYLKRRLSIEEEQNARQSNYFLDLSLTIRTPLNLMIGQIERYFKEYGARARGVESIQDVYGQAAHIRGLISDFVDQSNESLKNRPKHSKLLNEATGAVERNLFSGNLDVPLLCKELNMGKTKLTELLKDAAGMTPREFIENIRLQHAAQMILDGNHTIAEVSDSLGFSSPKYFAVRFIKKFGCPPSKYGRRG